MLTTLLPEPQARITWRGVLLMGLFYLIFGTFYAATIAWSEGVLDQPKFRTYLFRVLVIDYPLKAFWTLPAWWLIFRSPLDKAGWIVKLPAIVAIQGAWLFAWFTSYYSLLEWLTGPRSHSSYNRSWDVYIPALFCGVQFGILFLVRYTEQLRYRGELAQQLLAQAHESRVALLKAQINPHFLFNTLNSISASVPPEMETTRELIARLAHTFRFALDASRQEHLPLGEELAFLRSYLELEQARFGRRLRVRYAIDEQLLGLPVPPMLVQPLVENAVAHGLAPAVAGGELLLEVQRSGSATLRVAVSDTGLGLPAGTTPAQVLEQGTGVGLRNTHGRLLALGGAGLQLTPLQPHGLRVSFELAFDPALLPLSTPTVLRHEYAHH